jgi:L-asparagine transporter-like permease
MLQIVFLVSLESSQQGGVYGLGSMMFGLAVQKFLNIE